VVVLPVMRLLRTVVLIGALVFVGLMLLARDANAYTRTCGASGVWDIDTCERTEAIADAVQSQRELLELSSRGVWFAAGVLLSLIVAPMFVRAFRFWEE